MSQIDKYYLKEGFAGPLLQSAQTLRTHWSSVIVNLLIYTWFTLILLWAYCLTNFISNFNYPEFNYLILIIPSGISCVIISLWRLCHRRNLIPHYGRYFFPSHHKPFD